jgi:hypothetical protein
MKRIFCLIAVILFVAIAVFADAAPERAPKPVRTPKPNRSIDTEMRISLQPNTREARLIIPKNQLRELRAALDDLDRDDNSAAAVNAPALSRTQTVVSGMFLSLALVFGGVWFVRSGRAASGSGKTLVILAVTAGIFSAATLVFANIPPPLPPRSIDSKMFSATMQRFKEGSGKIKIEASPTATLVELIVPDGPGTPGNGEE